MSLNPFLQLRAPPLIKLPHTTSHTVVIEGKRVTSKKHLRMVVDADEADTKAQAEIARELERARNRARYQREKNDPEKMAKRKAWYEANRETVLAYKRDYDKRNRKRIQECQTAWMRRKYAEDPTKYIAASHRYYDRHREAILARAKARHAAKKTANASAKAA